MTLDYTWIIDDDAIFTFTVKKMLQLHNLTHRIDTFPNGMEAKLQLDNLREHKLSYPNVILLDINMPILDGWQFMDEFAQFPDKENIIVYLVSSSIDPNDRLKADRYEDIEDFVVKPVTLKALSSLISDARTLMDIS
ncbi:Response regulator receiver domain-containing protein [Nonlabens sp. Hel1_33_55]|uniref:response regulator n=1 Tax=Nonlabens sp. Hel1_33_55 TaxID=1336802 RepID=UPI000875BA1A|nr:response regulator [Nonlabens sp. Hel1_33_55]SCY29788.1 Response regulator receiver domain-containing protein [Nonlabens sp. Hel1_33_55]